MIAIIVHIDKTTLDGLRKYSAFLMYISLANYSWDVYNLRSGTGGAGAGGPAPAAGGGPLLAGRRLQAKIGGTSEYEEVVYARFSRDHV
jgi:hypothetical protein